MDHKQCNLKESKIQDPRHFFFTLLFVVKKFMSFLHERKIRECKVCERRARQHRKVLCGMAGGEEDEEDKLKEVKAEKGSVPCAFQGGVQTSSGWSGGTSRW